jgi:hypothetical protein
VSLHLVGGGPGAPPGLPAPFVAAAVAGARRSGGRAGVDVVPSDRRGGIAEDTDLAVAVDGADPADGGVQVTHRTAP